MRRGGTSDVWVFVLLVIAAIIGIFIVGSFAMKFYRKIKPFEQKESEGFSISISNNIQADGFFKTYFVGLVICSPALYYLFESL